MIKGPPVHIPTASAIRIKLVGRAFILGEHAYFQSVPSLPALVVLLSGIWETHSREPRTLGRRLDSVPKLQNPTLSTNKGTMAFT